MFRFTIRDVLWLMVVVGLSVGWWVEHRAKEAYINHMFQEHSQTANELIRLQYKVMESDPRYQKWKKMNDAIDAGTYKHEY